jgi:hypothetical protein
MTPVSLELTYAVQYASLAADTNAHQHIPSHAPCHETASRPRLASGPARGLQFLDHVLELLPTSPHLVFYTTLHTYKTSLPLFPNPAETLVYETAIHPSTIPPYHRPLSRHGTARLPLSPQHPMSHATRLVGRENRLPGLSLANLELHSCLKNR